MKMDFFFIIIFLDFLKKNPIIILLLLSATLLFVVLYLHENSNNNNNKKKKKKYHPIAGTILNQLFNFNRLHDYMTDLATKYKTYRLISTFGFEVYTSDPANVEYILKTNFHNYGKGDYNYTNLKDLLGDGIFTVDGDKWRNQRKVSSHEFSTRVLRTFSSAIFKRNAIKLANMLSLDINQTVDIQDAKVCFSDDKMPDGFNVRKGDMVAYQPYAMGRMKFIWGDDAYDFKPERWIDENGCFQQQSPFKFTAFQAGPRVCLGKEFAYRQMKIFGAILLHFFVFKLSDDQKVVKYKTMINLHIDNGLHIRVSHR